MDVHLSTIPPSQSPKKEKRQSSALKELKDFFSKFGSKKEKTPKEAVAPTAEEPAAAAPAAEPVVAAEPVAEAPIAVAAPVEEAKAEEVSIYP